MNLLHAVHARCKEYTDMTVTKSFFLIIIIIILVDALCQGRVGIRVKVTFYHLNIIYHLANLIFLPELNRKFHIYW